MPAANVIQLRQLLAEKFPELRLRADPSPACPAQGWPTGVPAIDAPLSGGLAKGALTEIVAARPGSGGALLLHALVRRAAEENPIVALIDGQDSFEVTQMEERLLARLLWIRCRSAGEGLKAADLLLRDGNVPVLLLDLAGAALPLRKIPATTWYRFQRLVEMTAIVCVVFTPAPMVSPARTRIILRSRFHLESLDQPSGDLLHRLELEISDARHCREGADRLRNSA